MRNLLKAVLAATFLTATVLMVGLVTTRPVGVVEAQESALPPALKVGATISSGFGSERFKIEEIRGQWMRVTTSLPEARGATAIWVNAATGHFWLTH